ncbi:hypothetical protein [Nonomuraea sp. NPDC052265]|uniref:hypothetical protein n=1 Tax=Nonomuraea sp. NPDC052265 TaxID=3364374 RepID=UPI0037C956E9
MSRHLHAITISEGPFDERLDVRLTRAAERVCAGLVDPDDFDDDHRGLSPRRLHDRLIAERLATEDAVRDLRDDFGTQTVDDFLAAHGPGLARRSLRGAHRSGVDAIGRLWGRMGSEGRWGVVA